jgi:hypothetical protein
VPVTDDTDDEADETFTVTLSSPTGGAAVGAPHVASATIVDDDAPAGGVGSPTWRQRSTPALLTPRFDSGIAYNSDGSRTVLFGGADTAGGLFGDTWEWDGTSWTRMATTGVAARQGSLLAYDPNLGVTVLFGGAGSSGPRNDTWTWDGAIWTEVQPHTATPGADQPTALFDASMAYMPDLGKVVLFGGDDGTGASAGSWAFNGASWDSLFTPMAPTARTGAAMAADVDGDLVLFGGHDGTTVLGDTWEAESDGTNLTWFPRNGLVPSPPEREQASIAFDADESATVLFGGLDSAGTGRGDTWAWDGDSWGMRSNTGTPPSDRAGAAMAAEPDGDLVLFGGLTGHGTPSVAAEDGTFTYGGTETSSVLPPGGGGGQRPFVPLPDAVPLAAAVAALAVALEGLRRRQRKVAAA